MRPTNSGNLHRDGLELPSVSRCYSFDDAINAEASVSDIRLPLIEDFLNRIGSDMVNESLDLDTAVTSMRLVCGPPGASRPLNIALMMFNDHPEMFFPYAWIDVVLMPDPTGDGMEERTFKGPVYLQIIEALRFIRNSVIAERIYKTSDRLESIRVFNYPFEAVREAVVNAVYHRDYRINEQITITVTPEHMEIKSFPGPDGENTDEDLKNLEMHSASYRNNRLGDYLKELGLAEGGNTGIPKMLRSLRNNGSDPPEFLTDPSRTYLRVIIPVHERFLVANPLIDHQCGNPKRRSREEIKERIVRILETRGCLPTREIMSMLGYKSTSRGAYEAIKELLSSGDVVYLYPDKPQDSRQRLCINPKKRQE